MRAPEFWQAQNTGSRLLAAALSPLGYLYGASVAWKANHAAPYRARAKVICVGNLTVGGTGKTPVAIAIAQMLPGRKIFFLSRGYGGGEKGPLRVTSSATAQAVGDEPLLLAQTGPTIVAADRSEGAKLADAEGADVIIMDDGHQNFALAKDLSIVVVDGESGFGNGRILPAGPLREPVQQGLRRADAIVIVGDRKSPLPDFSVPAFSVRLEASCPPQLNGGRVLAFAGIGRPEKFFHALPPLGLRLMQTKAYADHYFYTPSDIEDLKTSARNLNAQLVTTEKDYLRLAPLEREGISAVPVRAVFKDSSTLQRLLDRL
jgi:tetraacyldisaccharide 4'-kinase